MQIKLDSGMIDTLRATALADQEKAEAARKQAIKDFDAAKERYNATLRLWPGTIMEIQWGVAGTTATPSVTVSSGPALDNRGANYKAYYGWFVPSRSGGSSGHQITGNRGARHCNCPAAQFGRECWALKALQNTNPTQSLYSYDWYITVAGKRINVQRHLFGAMPDDFGLLKPA